MGIFQQFPYTNFHEMNLDQIIKIMREMQDEWAATKTEWADMKTFINNYFDTLDVSEEVLKALQKMALSGELGTIIDPVIATETTAWLEENITPTTPVVDASLTIEGAAADAKATGQLKPYFAGISSIPLNDWIYGKFPNFNTGGIWDSADYRYIKELEVLPNATYHYTGMTTGLCGVQFLAADKTFISGTNQLIFTTPATCKYINIGTYNATGLNPVLTLVGVINEHIDAAHVINVGDEFNPLTATSAARGVITPNGSVQPDLLGYREYFDVTPNTEYVINGYFYDPVYPIAIFLRADGTYQSTYAPASGVIGYYEDQVVTAPYNAVQMIINGRTSDDIKAVKKVRNIHEAIFNIYNNIDDLKDAISEDNQWRGKKIVWFGTSIPANGWFGDEHPQAYPQKVGALLGAEVFNEAIGSSCMHCKDPARITTDNPYGFNTNFEASSRCLTNTQAEMTWICDHWNSDIWTSGVPAEMTTWLNNAIHSFGYEQKVDKYLTADTFPDLFIFDHGFNDPTDPEGYYTTYGEYSVYTFRGAMNFIIQRILQYNPNANIAIVGNYTTGRDIVEQQTTIAEDWNIPIAKQWQWLGMSLTKEVVDDGYWNLNNGVYEWITDGTNRTYTMKNRLVPDTIHPWTDPTGRNTTKMARYLAKWLVNDVNLF